MCTPIIFTHVGTPFDDSIQLLAAPRTTRRCPDGAKDRSSNLRQVWSSMRAMVDLTTCLSNGSICWKVKGMIPSCHRNQGLSKWPPPSTDVPNSKRAGRSISLVQCPLRRVEWLQLQFKTGVLHLLTGRLTTGSHQVASLNLKAHIIIPQTNYLARCRVAQTHSLQFGNLSEFLSQVNMLYTHWVCGESYIKMQGEESFFVVTVTPSRRNISLVQHPLRRVEWW